MTSIVIGVFVVGLVLGAVVALLLARWARMSWRRETEQHFARRLEGANTILETLHCPYRVKLLRHEGELRVCVIEASVAGDSIAIH